ncbi:MULTISPECIES: phage tail assembly chaperone G [unclassified Granulicatella]|uniref:phage tail assembly chaperone G n=1 Tax=unclassified Granulicatella TaxID=2630493 RepID=UPI0010731DFB|nr:MULTISPECIES: hypothetical protein [unclassified Granulicatella]MBF0780514.1 hypothetical protein [Granulicatella sp. 19428wC4_WM01]TFU95329.1 hypothetical protein E4T68_05345 [Granulicatella sp. WM01]
MELKLHINSKVKTFQLPQPTFLVMLKTAELYKEQEQGNFLKDNPTEEELLVDMMKIRDYIVLAFGNQFTADEFDTGFCSDDIFDFMTLGRQLMSDIVVNPKKLANLDKEVN